MTNIQIRVVGTSNLGAIQKDIAATTAQVEVLAGALAKVQKAQLLTPTGQMIPSAHPNMKFLKDFKGAMMEQRRMFTDSVTALDQFRIKSVRVADGIDIMTDRVQKSKMGLREFGRELRSGGLDKLARQQIANRRAVVMEWNKSGDGTMNADVLTPHRRGIQTWSDFRTAAGSYNSVLGSVAANTVNWGKNTQWAGRQITAGFTMPLLMATAGMGKLAYDIDKGLTQVVKVYGDAATQLTTSDQMIKDSVMGSAKAMASTYGQGADETIEIASQLAAVGKTGVDLTEATAEVTRARILGEVDLQDAMKQTITLQSVWNMSSTELANAFNYMNSMENQTVLTMQDFAVGIPKVAGIIKSLNGDVQEAGTLLAAMKAGGIDAAEGATAVKSIAFKVMAPTSAALKDFTEKTQLNYEELVKGTDSVVERLRLFGEATKNLDLEDKTGLIQRMFGLHQGSKALTIIEQLTSNSEQMTRAFEVAGQSSEEWADTAARELEKLTGSKWNQFQQQWQTLKLTLAEFGKSALSAAAPLMEKFNGFLEWISGMSPTLKTIAKGLAVFFGVLGPLMMAVGIGANAVFSAIGGVSMLVGVLLKRTGLVTAEQIAIERMADKSAQKTKSRNAEQEESYARLAAQINRVTRELERKVIVEAAAQGNYSMLTGYKQQHLPNGQFADMKTSYAMQAEAGTLRLKGMEGTNKGVPGGVFMPGVLGGAVKDSGDVAKNIEKSNRGAKVLGGLMAVSMLGALADSDSLLGKVSEIAFAASSIGMALSMSGVGGFLAKGFTKPLDALKGRTGNLLASFKNLVPAITAVAGPLALVGAVGAGAFLIMRKKMEESRKEMEALGDSAEAYSKILGYTMTEAGEIIDENGEKMMTFEGKVKKFREENESAAKILQSYGENLKFPDQMTVAKGEGLKVINTGGTVEQAKEAAKIALKTMNQYYSEHELDTLTAKINFTSDLGQLDILLADAQLRIDMAMMDKNDVGRAESLWRGLDLLTGGKHELSTQSKQSIKDGAQQEIALYLRETEANQPKVWEAMTKFYADAQQKKLEYFKSKYPHLAGAENLMDVKIGKMGMSPEDIRELTNYLDTLNIRAEQWLALRGKELPRGGIYDVNQLTPLILTTEQLNTVTGAGEQKVTSVAQARRVYNGILREAQMEGKQLSEADKLAALNTLRLQLELGRAKTTAEGFTRAITGAQAAAGKRGPWIPSEAFSNLPTIGNKLLDLGFDRSEESGQRLAEQQKSIMSAAQGDILGAAQRSMDAALRSQERGIARYNRATQKSLAAGHERASESLASRQEAAENAFEARREAFQSRWEKTMDDFEKRNDARRKSIEDSYDGRIDKIRATIDAEQEAEDTRKKIFEAEKTRLSRLADMANKTIDFNMAINSGDMDQAARISNDMASTEQSWRLEDADAASGDAFDKRKTALEKEIDDLEAGKDAALEKIKAIEDAEKEALEEKKKREDKALEIEQEALRKSFDQQRKSLAKSQQAEQQALADRQQAEADYRADKQAKAQIALDKELAMIRAAAPRNEAELKEQMRKMNVAYDAYGEQLGIKGQDWAGIVGNALTYQIGLANTNLINSKQWEIMGSHITDALLKGGMNMTYEEFAKWMSTGVVPAGVLARVNRPQAVKQADGNYRIPGVAGTLIRHSGGIIGKGASKRTGVSGQYLSQSEVPVTALIGEAVLNRNATKYLGHDFIDRANRGERLVPEGIGGPDLATMAAPNIFSILTGMVLATAMKQAMMSALFSGSQAGASGGAVAPDSMGTLYPGGWTRPAAGRRSSPFGWRVHPITGKRTHHDGSDIAAPMGTPIYAARGGTVAFAANSGGRGNLTQINHGGGLATGYAHQSRFLVRPGQQVRTGQHVGAVGSTGNSTGPHLHFEYYVNGKYSNPASIIPGMAEGGYTLSDGLAQLHKDETVLTAPLSEKLKVGIDQMVEGGTTQLTIDLRGAKIYGVDDLDAMMSNAVDKAFAKKENRLGKRRTIGNVTT